MPSPFIEHAAATFERDRFRFTCGCTRFHSVNSEHVTLISKNLSQRYGTTSGYALHQLTPRPDCRKELGQEGPSGQKGPSGQEVEVRPAKQRPANRLLLSRMAQRYKTCWGAARAGQLACLRDMHKEGYPWDARVCNEAAKYGHLDCLAYLHEHGCPWNASTCALAAAYGHLDCLA